MQIRHTPVAAAILLFLLLGAGCSRGQKSESNLHQVELVQVDQRDVPIYEECVGTLDGLVNAQIRAQVRDYLVRRDYKEGFFVKKAQLMFEIDPDHTDGRHWICAKPSRGQRKISSYFFEPGVLSVFARIIVLAIP